MLKTVPPQPIVLDSTIKERLTAKHYVLSFIFDCNAADKILPLGNKKDIEKIGTEKMGVGRGNTFYKSYNTIVHEDLNVEENLMAIAGDNWRMIILKLSGNKEKLEYYLQSKNL